VADHKKQVIVTRVSHDRWRKAQAFEVEAIRSVIEAHDDWNIWWKKKFDNYKLLEGKKMPRILEVGCGPFTNLRLILPLVQTDEIYLEDPLLQSYMDFRPPTPMTSRIDRLLGRQASPAEPVYIQKLFRDTTHRVHMTSAPLEELPWRDELVDLVICINVLDHVYDYQMCMAQMNRVLKKGGILVFGQDLSNEEDYKLEPSSWKDVGHPIKLDENIIDEQLRNYKPLLKRILPRDQGRNPNAHYGTYLLIATKR
jgi:SAM-dependent methyltransferase